MFITSTVNAKSVSTSDLPLVVLAYGERSYLVKVTEKYEARAAPVTRFSSESNILTASCLGHSRLSHKSVWYRQLIRECRVGDIDFGYMPRSRCQDP